MLAGNLVRPLLFGQSNTRPVIQGVGFLLGELSFESAGSEFFSRFLLIKKS